MIKHCLAIMLSVLFLLLISAPTISAIVEDTVDVSLLTDVSEEEEEKNKELEVFFSIIHPNLLDEASLDEAFLVYKFQSYSKPDLQQVSQPPECFI